MVPFAANPLQPLIDVFKAVLVFFHDNVGLGWGFSIVVLTIIIRALLLPLALKQFRSMQSLARHQPEMKKLQDRYKGDKDRLNQEMMKFYRENKINPLASCFPLLAQIPVFISLFYMLRKDLRHEICPDINPAGLSTTKPCGETPDSQFFFIPDLTNKATGARRADRALRRLAADLDRDVDGQLGPQPEADHVRAAVLLRHVRDQLPGRPARLLDHHQPLDDRAAADHPPPARADATTTRSGRAEGVRGWAARLTRVAVRLA
jgi:YidC/Oxa1 family membrane protein insertase